MLFDNSDFKSFQSKSQTTYETFTGDFGISSSTTSYDKLISFYGKVLGTFIVGLGAEFTSSNLCNMNAPNLNDITKESMPWAVDFSKNSAPWRCGQ